jgi:hypothetical protein
MVPNNVPVIHRILLLYGLGKLVGFPGYFGRSRCVQ